MSETPIDMSIRAPLIGEHNHDIYVKELGLAEADIKTLNENGII
jgi:crotonobetainyl-CoA:carnitine CoA-transferase CaiB-like acyl-CoA transferase